MAMYYVKLLIFEGRAVRLMEWLRGYKSDYNSIQLCFIFDSLWYWLTTKANQKQ